MGLDRGRERQAATDVRHIRLIRPGEEEILLVTHLLDNQQYPASDLLAVYLTRWGIDGVFQQITQVFECAI